MSNKKQTAVEWLASELKNHLDMPHKHFDELLEQAKEMDKQNIKDAYVDGLNAHRTNFWNNSQDYKETYETSN